MVVASIAICTRLGSPVLVRNYLEIGFGRVESLLQSFPRLISSGQQHCFVENNEVRFLFLSLEQLYLVLITDKKSNLLQDLETLQLANRILINICPKQDEPSIMDKFMEIIFAFDELLTLGYKESVTMPQVNTILAMESHEEALQELIEKNKIQEAKEVAKMKMKQLELQKKESLSRKSFDPSMSASSPNPVFNSSADAMKIQTEVVDMNVKAARPSKPAKGMSLRMKQ